MTRQMKSNIESLDANHGLTHKANISPSSIVSFLATGASRIEGGDELANDYLVHITSLCE